MVAIGSILLRTSQIVLIILISILYLFQRIIETISAFAQLTNIVIKVVIIFLRSITESIIRIREQEHLIEESVEPEINNLEPLPIRRNRRRNRRHRNENENISGLRTYYENTYTLDNNNRRRSVRVRRLQNNL